MHPLLFLKVLIFSALQVQCSLAQTDNVGRVAQCYSLAANPLYPELFSNIQGPSLTDLRHPEAIESCVDAKAKLDSDSKHLGPTLYSLGRAHQAAYSDQSSRSDFEAAQSYFEKALKEGFPLASHNLGIIYHTTSDIERAKGYYFEGCQQKIAWSCYSWSTLPEIPFLGRMRGLKDACRLDLEIACNELDAETERRRQACIEGPWTECRTYYHILDLRYYDTILTREYARLVLQELCQNVGGGAPCEFLSRLRK